MLKIIKYWLSFIWPCPIYTGYSSTIQDEESARILKFKQLFNRRLSRNTIKYTMDKEFSLYELVHVLQDAKNNKTLYQLQHCATGHLMTVDDTVFNIIFHREEQLHDVNNP